METAVRILQRAKDTGGFKNGMFSGKNVFLEGSKNNLATCFLVKQFHRWLTVAPHGDGIFLKVSRIQRIIFGVGQMPVL